MQFLAGIEPVSYKEMQLSLACYNRSATENFRLSNIQINTFQHTLSQNFLDLSALISYSKLNTNNIS